MKVLLLGLAVSFSISSFASESIELKGHESHIVVETSIKGEKTIHTHVGVYCMPCGTMQKLKKQCQKKRAFYNHPQVPSTQLDSIPRQVQGEEHLASDEIQREIQLQDFQEYDLNVTNVDEIIYLAIGEETQFDDVVYYCEN